MRYLPITVRETRTARDETLEDQIIERELNKGPIIGYPEAVVEEIYMRILDGYQRFGFVPWERVDIEKKIRVAMAQRMTRWERFKFKHAGRLRMLAAAILLTATAEDCDGGKRTEVVNHQINPSE